MKKEVIIYDSTSLWEQADSVRAMLAEEQGISLADVTEAMVDDEINDGDIARRLCSASELKRCHNGDNRPNGRNDWLDTQARALHQACELIILTL